LGPLWFIFFNHKEHREKRHKGHKAGYTPNSVMHSSFCLKNPTFAQ